jgi:phosphoglycerate dehydrogenase-like enzyme
VGAPGPSRRPVAVFDLPPEWMRDVTRRVAPPGFDVRFLDREDPGAADRLLPDADFYVVWTMPSEEVGLLRRCKLVQLAGVGYDDIPVADILRTGIPVASTPEGTVVGVAEHAIMLILGLYKHVAEVHASMRAGRFDTFGFRPSSHFFAGKTLGIVGFGRIGRRVARLACAFDARVIYHDVVRADPGVERSLGATRVPLAQLVSEADAITVHTTLTPESTGLFDAARFARMKPGAIFINTSRGGTYDMDALYASLRDGHLAGAGLDVFNPEPPPSDHPIFQLPNVLCTPHMATGTIEATQQKAESQFANFQRVLRGEPPLNLVVLEQVATGARR